ncbi:MAG: glycosyltransferase family 2 protein [Streptococcaceae bacterium]|nr:glycosyltransferase family 2 protein [Streptococcaceae bacterium]
MQNSKVSIIVPIYNVAPYLEKCLNSIVNQTYHNLEIILVNDGATDDSPIIVNQFAEKDDRIIVINKANGGLSSARNAGLDICTGDYIVFIDSDDYVSRYHIENFIVALTKFPNARLAICQKIYVYGNKYFRKWKQQDEMKPLVEQLITSDKILELQTEQYLVGDYQKTLAYEAWGKMYHRSLWQDLRFEEGRLFEDNVPSFTVYAQVKEIVWLESFDYYYNQVETSIMNSPISVKKIEDTIYVTKGIAEIINHDFPKQQDKLLYRTSGGLLVQMNETPKKEFFDAHYQQLRQAALESVSGVSWHRYLFRRLIVLKKDLERLFKKKE